jgi:hypothetical protein
MKAVVGILTLLTVAATGVPGITTTPETVCKPGKTLVWLPGKAADAASENTKAEAIRFEFKRAMLVGEAWDLSWQTGEGFTFFGTRLEACANYSETIRLLFHRPRVAAQALQFRGKNENEFLVLYLPESHQSMWEALSWIKTWAGSSSDPEMLTPGDDLRVPQVSLSSPVFSLLVDGSGQKFKPEYEPKLSADYFPGFKSRRFWFDRPFFLFLWKEESELPHAGIWFGDTSAFVKY